MTERTLAALVELAAAVAASTDDCRELQIYGSLPEHLADAVADALDE